MCKESQTPFTKKKNNVGRFWSWMRKFDVVFHPILPFWTKVHRQRTNHAWPFQHNNVMHDVVYAHCSASARRPFVVKNYINYFCRKWQIVSLDKTVIAQLGSCRAFWSRTVTAIWSFNSLATIEVHYMEKNPGMFSSKKYILWLKKERYEHPGWHVGEYIIRIFLILEVN